MYIAHHLNKSAEAAPHDHEKATLGFWEIWNMSFGFLGIRFGFALQGGNMSRIFQTLGASGDEIPMLWIAAPLTGLIVQPIIGHLSGHTWRPRWGRRRPFFLIGAVVIFFFVPYSMNCGWPLASVGA